MALQHGLLEVELLAQVVDLGALFVEWRRAVEQLQVAWIYFLEDLDEEVDADQDQHQFVFVSAEMVVEEVAVDLVLAEDEAYEHDGAV